MKGVAKIDEGQTWHALESGEVARILEVDPRQGLSEEEVARRQERYGLNEIIDRGVKSPWLILWEQLTDVMVIILIISAAISFALGDKLDGIAILTIVVLNALLGFIQEYRAEQAMAALRKMAAPVVRVRRGEHVREVDAIDLVPGDVILLEAGSAIPADARLTESVSLRVQEAALTGESHAVDKVSEALEGGNKTTPLGDRVNMVYLGTSVAYGRASGIVTATGMHTELGRIAEMIQSVESEQTPLQRRMAQLGKTLAVAALGIVAVVFTLGLLRGENVKDMFFTAIAMAVAAVPEGLPAVVTIALALGAQRMLKRRALVRKLPAVEALGSVTVICSDKTGTLTENQMTVKILDVVGDKVDLFQKLHKGRAVLTTGDKQLTPGDSMQTLLLAGSVLCNDAVLDRLPDAPDTYYTVGDPTEGALLVVGARFDFWKDTLEETLPRTGEVPFTSERKRMTTLHKISAEARTGGGHPHFDEAFREIDAPYIAFTKGAVDGLVGLSSRVWADGKIVPLDEEMRGRIEASAEHMAKDGLRVLSVAFRPLESMPEGDPEDVEQDLVFVGMLAMIDPPRPEVKDAVAMSKAAGIRPVMITGDHPLTAQHIARDLDISDNGRVLTGEDLASMSTMKLQNLVEDVSVYARVSPEHKLKIVEALQSRGHIVAMTGDGVNDAPALRRSDIGVAMGITGTDVSKEASDMVLLDDNFATIVNAVKEGRTIFDNVRKFIKYTMTSNSGEIYVMLFAPFLGMPLPLTALQILWINLVTDGLPGLALAVEPAERNTMSRPPYAPNESIFARGMGRHILWVGLLMGLVSLGSGFWGWSAGSATWHTFLFTTLTLSQMGHAMAIRSERDSFFTIGPFTNMALVGAVLLTLVLQLLVIYLPPLQEIFGTQALSLRDLLLSLALSSVVFWGVELEKIFLRRNREK
jgi:P-type Ca2+ transporter type 2C